MGLARHELTGTEDLTPLSAYGGAAVILSRRRTDPDGPRLTRAQFETNGFTPLMLYGPDTRSEERFKQYLRPKSGKGGTNVAHLAYHHAFWPVIEDTLETMTPNSWLAVAEDSCWLMDETTPKLLH